MSSKRSLSARLEDYVVAIYRIMQEKRVARVKDISQVLSVTNASVTGVLHSLSDKALINYAPYEIITLTTEGENIAKNILRRHNILKSFFIKVLSVDRKAAEESACKMEHTVSNVILKRLVQFIEFVDEYSRAGSAGSKCIDEFGYFCEHVESFDHCEDCISQRSEEVKEKVGG